MRLRATPSAVLWASSTTIGWLRNYGRSLSWPCLAPLRATCAPTVRQPFADSDQGRPLAYNTPCDRARASLG